MHIDAFICDAVTNREGLLHILGAGITMLTRREFPAPLSMSIAVTLTAEHAGTFNVTANVRADGSDAVLDNVTGIMLAGPVDPPEDGIVLPFTITLGRSTVPAPGKYFVDIFVDGALLRTLWFRVRELPMPTAPLQSTDVTQ